MVGGRGNQNILTKKVILRVGRILICVNGGREAEINREKTQKWLVLRTNYHKFHGLKQQKCILSLLENRSLKPRC